MFTEQLSVSCFEENQFSLLHHLWIAPLHASLTHYYLTNTVIKAPWQRWKMFRQLRKPFFLMKVLEQRSRKKIQGKIRTETIIPAIYNLTFISQPSSSFKKWTSGLIRPREIKQVHKSHRQAMNRSRNRIWSSSPIPVLCLCKLKAHQSSSPNKTDDSRRQNSMYFIYNACQQSSLFLNWTQNGNFFGSHFPVLCSLQLGCKPHSPSLSVCWDTVCQCNSPPSEKFWCLQPINSSYYGALERSGSAGEEETAKLRNPN